MMKICKQKIRGWKPRHISVNNFGLKIPIIYGNNDEKLSELYRQPTYGS